MSREFTAYGPSHVVVLVVFALCAVALIWLGRRQTEAQARRFGRVVGGVTAAIYLVAFVHALIPFDVRWSVPLHLTDLAAVATTCAWWSQRRWAFALMYYWGLVLSVQALISPALTGPDFPSIQFFGFWALHLLVVWAAIYLTWGRGMRPRWRDFWFVVAVTLLWGSFTMAFNSLAGSNYGFLNRKPTTASVLDMLGPWPWYVVVAASLVFIVWVLMTWPWERARRRAGQRSSH